VTHCSLASGTTAVSVVCMWSSNDVIAFEDTLDSACRHNKHPTIKQQKIKFFCRPKIQWSKSKKVW